jgi:hypothetical protein
MACSEKIETQIKSSEKSKVCIATSFMKPQISEGSLMKKSTSKNPQLTRRRIRIFKQEGENFRLVKYIDNQKYSSKPSDPNSKLFLELEKGNYLVDVVAYCLVYDSWLKKESNLSRAYNWFWNDNRLPDEIYVNKVNTVNFQNSDVFAQQTQLNVEDDVNLTIYLERIVGKIKFVSTTPIPEDAKYVTIQVNANGYYKFADLKSYNRVSYYMRLTPSYFNLAPTNFDYNLHLLPSNKAQISITTHNEKREEITKLSVEIDIQKGVEKTVTGNLFPEKGLKIELDYKPYVEEQVSI